MEYSVSYYWINYSSKEIIRRVYNLSEFDLLNAKFNTSQAKPDWWN